ncbi:succinate dehydrogenase assembly factor 3, mitochondrial-like [Hydractinia symbiolongicarpus]|uniref:succinate dehydrogenase assembly factor 3, mitochondrial-like n=1 Tax=Hydractinia symbiolongicarpus TaxID=13093 RepID=UPI00254E0070|nr:succinate dehydrogenase assembly factor 3, mitochondrial-like [Hydractinia symbiolongicarpus]
MQQKAIPRLFMVQRLYRRVLKLHRCLPVELKNLGDEYAKDEFRRNKTANQLQAYEFIKEWKNYCTTLENQLQLSDSEIGKNLQKENMDSLSQDQLGQLYQLQQETVRIKKNDLE